jgi:EF hand
VSAPVRHAVVALAALALASCGMFGDEQKPVRASPLYSPNGEPLSGGSLGEPTCEAALGKWFDHVAAGSGAIDENAFLADAGRQFTAMDLDKSGALTPSELARYRAPYLNPNAHARDYREEQRERDQGRGPPPQEDVEDPVMVADTELRNRVTRDQFLAYAQRNFAALDANRDGRLERPEVLAACKH